MLSKVFWTCDNLERKFEPHLHMVNYLENRSEISVWNILINTRCVQTTCIWGLKLSGCNMLSKTSCEAELLNYIFFKFLFLWYCILNTAYHKEIFGYIPTYIFSVSFLKFTVCSFKWCKLFWAIVPIVVKI